MEHEGVTIVYVYQVEKKKEQRCESRGTVTVSVPGGNAKWLMAGGLLIALSIMFSAIDARISGMGASIGLSGWDLYNLIKEAGEGPRRYLAYIPIITALSGAAMATSAYMSMKGKPLLSDKVAMWMSVACIALPVVLFVMLYTNSDSAVSMMSLFLGDITIYPGAGTLMQIAGGIIAYRVTRPAKA